MSDSSSSTNLFVALFGGLTTLFVGGAGALHARLSRMERECEEGIKTTREELMESLTEKQRQHELILQKLANIPTRDEVRQDRIDLEARLTSAIQKNGTQPRKPHAGAD
jgi:hypothetical protein